MNHSTSRTFLFVLLCLPFASLFGQPASNACGAAINITNFSGGCTAYNSVGSTQDIVTGTCNEGVQNTWFRVTPPNTAMTITVNGAPSSRPEITLGFFTGGNCVAGNWTEVLCTDASGNYASISMAATGLDCSQEYYIFVTNNSDANQGPATICITSLVPPANNLPTSPAVLQGCDTVFTANNTNANNCGTGTGNCIIPFIGCSFNDIDNNPSTGDAEGADVGVSIENDVWWRFCPSTNNSTYTLTLTPTTCSTLDGIQVAVLQGAANNMPILLAGGINGQNFLVPGPHVLNFTVPLAANGCVFIEVDGFAGAECTFGVNLNCTSNCPICTLPVELVSFNGTALDNRIRLNWRTQEEVGTSHYEVLRQDALGEFVRLGQVEALGTWAGSYMYEDLKPLDGSNRYRLRMVDQDGQSSLSEIISVDYKVTVALTFSPNPFGNRLDCNWSKDIDGPVTLSLFDLAGRQVLTHTFSAAVRGGSIEIPVGDLAPGHYTYKASAKSLTQRGHLVKQ